VISIFFDHFAFLLSGSLEKLVYYFLTPTLFPLGEGQTGAQRRSG
jgi:hypothetical protein